MPRIETAGDLGLLVRAARMRRRMTQEDLAVASGVSRRWVVSLEAGKPRAELGLVLRVLSTLGIPLTADAPEAATPSGSVPTHDVDLDAHLRRLAGSG
ncbi:MAG: helix-turn-helix protein [Frankiales bacterium]|jgi:HTH-type transcriptional regulator/antitoxin HipB|nr:helix-turn-helix protein [Frankiales bacterium]